MARLGRARPASAYLIPRTAHTVKLVSDSDSASVTEAQSIVVNTSSTDVRAAVEAQSLTAAVSSADTSTAIDSGTLVAHPVSADLGAGNEITGPLVVKPVSPETGIGIDSGPAPPATLSSADSSTGTDLSTLGVPDADGSAVVESEGVSVHPSDSDSSTVVETAVAFNDSNPVSLEFSFGGDGGEAIVATGSSADASAVNEAAQVGVSDADGAHSADSGTVTAHIADSDGLTAHDSSSAPSAAVASRDTLTGAVEAASAPSAHVSASDTSAIAENTPRIAFATADTASGTDSGHVGVASADSSTGTEHSASVRGLIPSSDSATAVPTEMVDKGIATPQERTYIVPNGGRILYATTDSRTVIVDAESRTLYVVNEVRTVIVQSDNVRVLVAPGSGD